LRTFKEELAKFS